MRARTVVLSWLLSGALAACATSSPAPAAAPANVATAAPAPAPPPTSPTDAAFARFIATHPSTDDFQKTYPGVQLILPGVMTTDEMRPCCTRYFPDLDAQGHIGGGSFH